MAVTATQGLVLADIADKIRGIDFAMLTTRSDTGRIIARPMSNNREVDFDGNSHFFAYDDTQMVADIARDPVVALGFQSKSGLFGQRPFVLAIEGRAELVRDPAGFAEHWHKALDGWFQRGIETPGLVMIKVHATHAHYWDGMDGGEISC